MPPALRIATRSSSLALWQARFVRDLLRAVDPVPEVELVEVTSTGDAIRDRPLYTVGGVGLFTKEVQDAVLEGRADIAVHSLKDLPTQTHPDLVLAAVPDRAPARDALLAPVHRTLEGLPERATVATSSLRRRAQLLRHRPDLRIVDIRGNVETRIRRMHERSLDGLVLAEAGIRRLGLDTEITEVLDEARFVPAVGQGALGIECRADDEHTRRRLREIEHEATRQAVDSERSLLRALQGGCTAPIGAHARVVDGRLALHAIVANEEGTRWLEDRIEGRCDQAPELGSLLAERLLTAGARELIR